MQQYSSNLPKSAYWFLDVERYFSAFHSLLMHPKLGFRNFTVDLLHCILSSTLPLAVCTAASPHFTLCIIKILNHIWDVWSSSFSHITVTLVSSTAPVLIWFISTCPSYFYYVIKEEYENCHTNYCSYTYMEIQIRTLDVDLKLLPFI